MTFAKGLPSLFLRVFKGIAPAVVLIVVAFAPSARTTEDDWSHNGGRSWIGTWSASPQAPEAIPIALTGFTNQTLRQIVFTSLGGRANEFSANPLNRGYWSRRSHRRFDY
jgi:hypothetical protein